MSKAGEGSRAKARYAKVATGGTFDDFHVGHKRLLERSFESGEFVVIGLTSDEFARRQGKDPRHTYREREAELEAFIRERFPGRGYAISKLDDFFGPGIASREVEALVASPETAERVGLANKLRAEKGFPPLDLVVVEWVLADDGTPISSTRIRDGEIDEDGVTTRGRRRGGGGPTIIGREALSLYVIKVSLGLGGSLLAAIFVSEAYLRGGFLVPYAVGVFIMVGLTARFFGSVKVWVYCLATLGWVALLLFVGLP